MFDLGEVLVPSTGVLPRLAAELGVSEEELAAAYWPPRPAYDRGEPSVAYWTAVVEGLGRSPEPDLLAHLEDLDSVKWSTLPPASAALLDQLAGDGVRLCVLSNAPAPLADAVRAASWSDPIDHLVFSADAGFLKPEPAIYAHADAVYGTVPGEVVFFDDRADNIDAARVHGWDAHIWVDPETAVKTLARGMTSRARNPTIIDVARAAGVSKSVVSRVFTGQGAVGAQTRERVLAAAAELGYVVNAMARAMVARRTYTIGVFVRDAATPFYGHLLTAMQERASHHGYRVVTATGSGRFELAEERHALETLVQLQVEGLVVCSGLLPASDVAAFAARLPTVVAGRPETHADVTSVFCDEDEGGAGLADHVADLGHRCVAVIGLSPGQSLTMAPRTAAMGRRLRERGVAVVEVAGGLVDEVGELVPEIRARSGVTAVMAPSDLYAVRLLEALAAAGVDVPGQLSVTGYDGIGPYRTPLIGLTTWRQPVAEIGARAVDAVVGLLDADTVPPHHRSLAGELVAGRTAGPPPC